VIPLLRAQGYNVVAVQNPLSSLSDDVAATKRAIARLTGPVILVGHSWAGMVISDRVAMPAWKTNRCSHSRRRLRTSSSTRRRTR
jgi:hypothetical protein